MTRLILSLCLGEGGAKALLSSDLGAVVMAALPTGGSSTWLCCVSIGPGGSPGRSAKGRWSAVSGARCRQQGPVYLSTGYFLWPILPGLVLPEVAEACVNCAGL